MIETLFGETLAARRGVGFAIAAATLLCAAGCGSSSNTRAGSISVTDPAGAVSGQVTSIAIGRTASLVMTPVGDSQAAGVDWSVTCGGSPVNGSMTGGACGTLTPAHTPDGAATLYSAPAAIPLGGTVTINAAVTSDPSAISSVTLSITPAAISIAFLSPPPASVSAGSMTALTAQLTNDTSAAGVSWSVTCGSSSCGSFNPVKTGSQEQTTYTAPSAVPTGGNVTITAKSVADGSKSISATIVISAPPPPIAIALASSALQVGVSSSAGLIATVENDASDAGVDWTVTCASPLGVCGRIAPSHTPSGSPVTYTAPSNASSANPVTITATATATEGATPVSAVATVTVTSSATISVTVAVQPASVTPLGTSQLSATVKNDASNAGVTWSVSCGNTAAGACGSITNVAGSGTVYTATYNAPSAIPAGGEVLVSATPNASANSAAAGNPGLAAITVAAVPPTISFLTPPPASVAANSQAGVSAVVANDVPPGGVNWTVQCGSTDAGACGSIAPYQTASAVTALYTAPPVPPSGTSGGLAAGQVAIVASSTSNPSVTVTSAPVTIVPSTALSVRFLPYAPTQIQASATVNLNAAVVNDATSAGVDWQVCSSGCGFFTTTPAIPAIPATATTPFVPAVPAITTTSVTAWPNGLPIPYTAPAVPPEGGALTITAAAAAAGQTGGSASSVTSVTITSLTTGPALQGVVQAGTVPVAGASVSLYAAGTSGFGSAATLVYSPQSLPSATTDKNGSFTISAGYSCPQPGSQMYLIASGGQVGANGRNANLTLMTALGTCATLSSTPVVMNEVTTVGSVWPLAQFAANDALIGNSSYLYLGSDAGDTAGLANAFAAVNNLVDITTGQAIFNVPAGNAAVPYAEINTLADILNTCTASGGGFEGDGSACGTLFTDTDPLGFAGVFNSTPPADTVQAAFNIAQHPYPAFQYAISVSGLFQLATLASPVQPILNAPPADFSISLNFTGGGGLSASSVANFFALDASGDVWITDTANSRLIEWNNQGTPVSPSGFSTASLVSPGPLAIDTAGDVWTCDSNGLTVVNSLAKEIQASPFIGGGLLGTCQGMAFDGLGDLWTANSTSVSKFNSFGIPLSPSTGYTIPVSPTDATLATPLGPIAIDDSGNVWAGASDPEAPGQFYLAELDNGSGLPNFLTPTPPSGPASNLVDTTSDMSQTQIAINASGGVWLPNALQSGSTPLEQVPPYAGAGSTDQVKAGWNAPTAGNPFTDPRGVAFDGAGKLWTGSTGAPGFPGPGVTKTSPGDTEDDAHFVAPSLANRPLLLAIDGSGNVWALLDNNTVTEYIGLAAPAVTPLSLAVKNKKLAAQP